MGRALTTVLGGPQWLQEPLRGQVKGGKAFGSCIFFFLTVRAECKSVFWGRMEVGSGLTVLRSPGQVFRSGRQL